MKKILVLLVVSTAVTAFAEQVVAVKIKALDGFGGETGAVASMCQTKVGAAYDEVTVTHDVNSLKKSDRFEYISAEANKAEGGVEVVFSVRRKVRYLPPMVVKGCEAFSESEVAKESGLEDGCLYGESDLEEAAAKVRAAYMKKGYSSAKVIPHVEIVSGTDATITFSVDEGECLKTGAVVFKGAAHAVESSVLNRKLNPFYQLGEDEFEALELHEAVGDFPWWNPIGWFADAPVTADQRVQTCSKVAEVYRNHGFLDVRVTGPELEAGENGEGRLVYTVEEGPRYRVGACSIRGLVHYTEADVKKHSALPAEGSVASQKALDDAAQSIRVTIGSGKLGLADSQIVVKPISRKDDPSTVDLVFQVTEGRPVKIGAIKIIGNDYTKDNVIRREILLNPGDPMLEDKADLSRNRLESLDYFSRVRYYLEADDSGAAPKDAEYRTLVYEVEEKSTGNFSIGVGASSVDSVYIMAEANQNNFDLFAPRKFFRGGGQKGRAYIAWGPRYQSAELGFSEPYFLTRMLELSVDVYRRMRWYDQYDLIRSGGMVSLSYPVLFWNPERLWNDQADKYVTFGRLGFGFSGEYIEMEDVREGSFWTEDGELVSFEDEKHDYSKAFEPVFHVFWTKDTRDNYRMPTDGYRVRLFGDLGPGTKSSYWRLGVNYRRYWNVVKRYNHVLMLGVRAETIDAFDKEVPIYNRMFLGGPKSIRGIEYRNVAPMVRNSGSSWDPWGGQTLACVNLEYTVPIFNMFRLAAFTDLGCVGRDEFDLDFSDNFAWTAGLGARLDIPMFPIRLDFGFPIEKPDHAEEEVFSFTVGYDF